jgi:hypothetical protein
MHFEPQSFRFSEDLDYFHDLLEKVTQAFELDKKTLSEHGYKIETEIFTPAYIRALVRHKKEICKIEWSRDSAWRFMPIQVHSGLGHMLHPIDLCINKLLALVGRDEARDFLDVLQCHTQLLSLGAQCWAACGKDPGFSPNSLLEILKRKGKYREEDFKRLHLASHFKINIQEIKQRWLSALAQAELFVSKAPQDQLGCLYYSKSQKIFLEPKFEKSEAKIIVPHYGKPGGVLPSIE